jgi:hypothetical protein
MDKDFEKTFSIKYYIVTDAPPAPSDKLSSYNQFVKAYMDNKFGRVWRAMIRNDVL